MKNENDEQVKEPARNHSEDDKVICTIVNEANSQVDNEEANRCIQMRIEDLKYANLNYDDVDWDIDYIKMRLAEEFDEDDAICIL